MTAIRKDASGARWGYEKLVEVFGADLRSLALFRIVLALLVLVDLTNRATDFYAHYTDAGVLPRTVLLEEVLSRWAFSVNLMNGEPLFQAAVFAAAAAAALGMLVGYRTRLVTFIVWVLVLSIQWRNPLILNSGDVLLRMLLFWGMFLPLGAFWSVDRALKVAPPRLSMRFLSLATVALFLQIAFVYWFTAILKTDPAWRTDGTAIYYALGSDQFATRIGAYLYQFPDLLTVLTYATVALEAFGPFLLFFPFFTGPVRTGAVLAYMNLHFGIWLTMNVGLFSWTAALCMVCFLPTWFWDRAGKLYSALPERAHVARRVRLAAAHLAYAYLSPVRTRLSRMVNALQPPLVGLAERGGNGPGRHAMRVISSPETLAADPTQQGHAAPEGEPERGVAAGPKPTMLRSSLATNALAFFFLVYVFLWNLGGVVSFTTVPERIVPLGTFLGLEQYWAMFAPAPPKGDLWHVIPGNLRDGRQVNLLPVASGDFSPHELTWKKPPYVREIYKNEHWRKYFENLNNDQFANQRLYFGQYVCREWNARHTGSEQLMTFKIAYMWQPTHPGYRQSAPQETVLWEHHCF